MAQRLIVQKYGGTSVGTPEKIKRVASKIVETKKRGASVVVAVSAIGHTTDELLGLAANITSRPHDRELDMLLSAGERISMALLSMALRDLGHNAISFTGSQAGIITDGSHTRARIIEIKPIRVCEELAKDRIVIVAGFQGVSQSKEITTLGRGGSDTTAVAMAAALKADRCEVYTDVAGIYSADPRKIPTARRYEALPADLVFEMAVKGAQVMHARSIEIARERRFPIYVGLSHLAGGMSLEESGTMIIPRDSGTKEAALEVPKVVAVVSKDNLRAVRFSSESLGAVLEELERESILVHDLRYADGVAPGLGTGEIIVLVDRDESAAFLARHDTNADAQAFSVVSIVGYQLQQNARIPSRAIGALGEQGIRPSGLTCNSQSITVWLTDLDPARLERTVEHAVRCLHDALIG